MQSRRAERIVYCYYVDDFVHVFLCGLFNAIILSFLVDPAFFENVKSLFGAGGSVSFIGSLILIKNADVQLLSVLDVIDTLKILRNRFEIVSGPTGLVFV